MSEPIVERREFAAQPVLFVRRRASRKDLSAAIEYCFAAVFAHVGRAGLSPAGPPFTRYLTAGPNELTIEAGLPLAAPAPGAGEIEAGYLHGGPVVLAVHAGAYDTLEKTYAVLERYVSARGLKSAGPPWESYLTDPTEHPNPDDWRTEVYWPVSD